MTWIEAVLCLNPLEDLEHGLEAEIQTGIFPALRRRESAFMGRWRPMRVAGPISAENAIGRLEHIRGPQLQARYREGQRAKTSVRRARHDAFKWGTRVAAGV